MQESPDAPDAAGARTRVELVEFFERLGYVMLENREELETFLQYVAEYNVPTSTSVDRETGVVTLHRRVLGSIEGW